jgi:hypothetical protein
VKSKQHHTSHLIEKQRVSANTKNNAVAENGGTGAPRQERQSRKQHKCVLSLAMTDGGWEGARRVDGK